MRDIRNQKTTGFALVKTAAAAAIVAAAVGAAPAFAEDAKQKQQTSQAASQGKRTTEDMAAYESDRRVQAHNEIFWLSTNEFIGQKVTNMKGETLGTIEKIVMDPRENRGEAVVSKADGGMFVLPLDRFWLNNDQVAVVWSLSPSDLQYLTSVYETESGEGYWQDVPADESLLGTYVYSGSKDYIEQKVMKQQEQ